ncbi:MAG: hypothetical protein KDK97_08040 [Verrucomicrobiales bacterium]|nr:hypothetical protein [Verrucomicrobiales bacterium]
MAKILGKLTGSAIRDGFQPSEARTGEQEEHVKDFRGTLAGLVAPILFFELLLKSGHLLFGSQLLDGQTVEINVLLGQERVWGFGGLGGCVVSHGHVNILA